MSFSAHQIALMVQGQVIGNPEVTVAGFGKIEEATSGELAFLANPKYEDFLYTTQASIVLINEELQLKQPIQATLIRVPDAYSAFGTLLHKYQAMQQEALVGVEQPSFIHETAQLGSDVYVGAFVYIGKNVTVSSGAKLYPQVYLGDNVTVGVNSVLHSGVKVYHDCHIGNHAIIHAGSVIGSDGFGFAPQHDGSYQKIPQTGNVIIEHQVEIGANTTIDRATIGSTIIRSGAKLDNLVQIAHNVEVGEHTAIAAQAGISGSSKLGKRVLVGGQAGIAGHLKIGDGVRINGQSGINKSQPDGIVVTGTPAFEYQKALKSQSIFKRLPELEKQVRALQTQLEAIRQSSEGLAD